LLADDDIITGKINIADGFKISNDEFKESLTKSKDKDGKKV